MLTQFFINLGLTRDSVAFFWSRLVSGATILLGLYAVQGGTFLEPYLSPTGIKWAMAAAVVVLWLAGRYDSSPLPGAKK